MGISGSSGSRPFPLPLLDRFGQHPPKLQFQVEPFVTYTMPKGDGVGGRGECGGEDFQSVICVGNRRAIVIHEWFPLLWPQRFH
jgi:hypothetical protein